MFDGVRYISISELRLSQLYLNADKIAAIEAWFDPHNLSNFEPLYVHDFGDQQLTLTDGHSRAFVAYKNSVEKLPVVYDTNEIVTSDTGMLSYKNDIEWCKRFGLRSIADLSTRIVTAAEYQNLWIERCDKAYDLLTQTTEQQRATWQAMYPQLFLYGISEDLKMLYFENASGDLFEFPA